MTRTVGATLVEAPPIPASTAPVASLRRRDLLAFLLFAAAAVQIAQGYLARPSLGAYPRSYWLVTYEAGFTRRGLAGELIRLVTGAVPTVTVIDTLQSVLTGSLVVAIGLVVVAAWQRATVSLDLAAIALCVSPFVFDFVVYQRRPDQLGLLVVVVYGLALYRRPTRATTAAVVAGLALAFAVGAQDSVLLQCVPWAALLTVLASTTGRTPAPVGRRLAFVCVPPAVVAAVSVVFGRLDQHGVNTLVRAARRYPWLHGDTTSVFGYLGDDLRTSLDRVAHFPTMYLVGSITVCAVVVLLQGALMLGFRAPHFARRADVPHARLLTLALAACGFALVAMLALGIDWARWFASFGLMATVTWTLALLSRDTPTERDRGAFPTVPAALVATYLVLLAPLNDVVGSDNIVRYLLWQRV